MQCLRFTKGRYDSALAHVQLRPRFVTKRCTVPHKRISLPPLSRPAVIKGRATVKIT